MRQATCMFLSSILLAVVTMVHAAPQVDAQACTLEPTDGTETRTVGGQDRRYLLHVPEEIVGAEAMLVLSLHGLTNVADVPAPAPELQEAGSQLSRASDQYKFIVAYPEGRANPLRVPFYPPLEYTGWDFVHSSSPDIDFLLDVVADISATYCIDPQRVHVEGLSMGAAMAQRMACEVPDVIASAASHSSVDVESQFFEHTPDDCVPARPISVFMYCGEADFLCMPVQDVWAERLDCPAPTTVTVPFGSAQHYTPCNAGTAFWARTWTGSGHLYPANVSVLDRYHAELAYLFTTNPRP
jgi:polyhydroxybutyrate depolymerase